jgi:DNA-binding transcriptional MerR regulator
MSGMTIGQVARHAGGGVETVRFYERKDLIAAAQARVCGWW